MPTKKVGQLMTLYEIIRRQRTMPVIDGWVGYGLDKDGNVMAGKKSSSMDAVSIFEPVGEWHEVAGILAVQKEFRAILSTLSDKEIDEFRVLRGHPTMAQALKKKKEFNPNHDPETGQFTDGEGGPGGGGGGDKSTTSSAPKVQAVDFDTAFKNHDSFTQSNGGLKGYSYDPTTNTGYSAFTQDGQTNKADTGAMYAKFADGKSDLYVIGMTNHGGQLSRESQSAYIQLTNESKYPLVGYFEGQAGFGFTDISFPTDHGVTDADIIRMLDANVQESALVIDKNGEIRFLNGSNVPVPKGGPTPIG